MKSEATLIHNLSSDQISSLFAALQIQIANLSEKFEPKSPPVYLTRKEVAELLKCNISTVHHWTVAGKLLPYMIGNRVYYKRAEIDAVLMPLRTEGEVRK